MIFLPARGDQVGVVFDAEFGNDPRFHPIAVVDPELNVGEYVACLEDRRRLALVRAFLDVARQIAAQHRERH